MSRQKLRNKKVEVDGVLFDSKREAKRYADLLELLRAGEISDLQLQPVFELIPAQHETFPRYGKKGQRLKDGTRCIENGCVYKADFSYKTRDGLLVVEDAKGYRNPNSATYAKFVIKRKLMLWRHGIRVVEV